MNSGGLEWGRIGSGHILVRVDRGQAYPMAVARGASEALPRLLRDIIQDKMLVIITEDRVAALWLDHLLRILEPTAWTIKTIVVPSGERSKSWATTEYVLSKLLAIGTQRRTLLLALGGGMICDLTGFVASIFMRGVPYVNVPTSLIGQLDAAVGGKVGIDFGGSKNLVGGFHHPVGVVVDPDFMSTLPAREIRGGLAEAAKIAILDPQLFAQLERASSIGPVQSVAALTDIVEAAIVRKLELLADDPFERSLRRPLNLGHTIGHAIEAATGFAAYRHGEAVAIGISVATEVSSRRGVCSIATRDRILRLLCACGLGLRPPVEHLRGILIELNIVRRIRNGMLQEVLPRDIGQWEIADEVDDVEYTAAFDALANRLPAPLEVAGESL